MSTRRGAARRGRCRCCSPSPSPPPAARTPGDATDLAENRVGAMADYGVGDQFKATEPLTFSILYNNHPNYPLKEDWLFWSELTKRTNVKLEPVAVPLATTSRSAACSSAPATPR